ncbi:Putative porin [Flavobacteriaceae bacterium MAR_2010_188]|nr:Putative porin [Flavobacteriaceae bacterium MAR_2010_188]
MMHKNLFFILFIITCISQGNAQDINERPVKQRSQQGLDSITQRGTTDRGKILKEKADIKDYLIIDHKNDTTYVDTTLTIQKYYRYNYLRKDNFNLLAFSNIGQTYNNLSVDFSSNHSSIPKFGAQARHFNYLEIEDINYYHVPTPLTELLYKSAFEQGQLLDAIFTINTSRQFNMAIGYKGLRSLGKYQNILSSTGNFRVMSNYHGKNNRYKARGHIVTQDLLNNENGGITDEDVENFRSGDNEFLDRSVFDPYFQDAENILVGKRFHLEQEYSLIKQNDSLQNGFLDIGNVISFEDKYYRYKQTAARPEYFGQAFGTTIRDKVTLEDFKVRGYARFNLKYFGTVQANLDYQNINYGYNTVVNLNGTQIPNRIKDDFFKIGGTYNNRLGKVYLNGEFSINLTDNLKGYFVNAVGGFDFNEENKIQFGASVNNSRPNYNYILYQSDYANYNWYNPQFENQFSKAAYVEFNLKNIADIKADVTSISNYTYFTKNENTNVKPLQYNDDINYVRLKAGREFRFGNFGLDNTIMYQNVLSGSEVINVPEIITRNTLYYQNHLFKRALFLQTGVSFNYFTEYNMNGYDSLLAEFYVQNDEKLGNFPRLDFFVNAKIRQTRIFLIAEHFNSSFTGYNFFSAPNYPYRDFSLRFGIVWDFFL